MRGRYRAPRPPASTQPPRGPADNNNMSKTTKNDSVFTMSTDELAARVAKAKALFAEVAQIFPGLVTMTEGDRRHSDGKLRTGEGEALASVLDVADRYPQYFAALADKDGGVDPHTFETDFLRDHLARREILGELATAAVDAIITPVGDTVLLLGEHVRPVLLAGYQIAKPIAANDEAVRSQLAPALDFYRRIGRRGAETKAKKASAGSAK